MTNHKTKEALFKKICLIASVAIGALILLHPHHAKAYGYDWDISDFHTEIIAQEEGTLNITETITADFTREQHHGIYRTIPYKYRDQNFQNYNLRITFKSITDEAGNPLQYSQSKSGDYIRIQIGDPDRYVNEKTTYKINYEVQRAITAQPDHEEIYWNATGTEWDITIKNASATITLPSTVQEDQIKGICYTGTRGSQAQNCQFNTTGNTITFQSTAPLHQREGLTFAIKVPKKTFTPVPFTKQLTWFLTDNWPYAIPFIVLAILTYLWYTRGRDPYTGRETIMPIYKPPNGLSPAEAGTIIDERADMHDLSATIIDLAVRGYITIKEIKTKVLLFSSKDYEFTLIKDFNNDTSLKDFEIETLKGIFGPGTSTGTTPLDKNEIANAILTSNSGLIGRTIAKAITDAKTNSQKYNALNPLPPKINTPIATDTLQSPTTTRKTKKLSELRNSFYLNLKVIKEKLYKSLVTDGYFPVNPEKVRSTYNSIGFAMAFIPLFFGIGFLPPTFLISTVTSGILIFGFGFIMPAKTQKGVTTLYQIKGLEEFIRTAEKDRLKWQEKENIFEQLLPYAIAFKLADKWATAFQGIYKNPPSWYSSSDPTFRTNFNTIYFMNAMTSLNNDLNSTLPSSPRSSGGSGFGGGGFSGGGFGGGGGGSW